MLGWLQEQTAGGVSLSLPLSSLSVSVTLSLTALTLGKQVPTLWLAPRRDPCGRELMSPAYSQGGVEPADSCGESWEWICLFLLRTLVIGFRAQPDNPRWFRLKILNLITLAKTLFPNKVTFTLTWIYFIFGVGEEGMQPATRSKLLLLLISLSQDHTAKIQASSLFSGSLQLNLNFL